MRKRTRSLTALAVACSMALSLAFGGGAVAAGSDEEPPAINTDPETGYTYVLYQEDAGEGEAAVQRARITGYNGSDTELAIPAQIGQYSVGSIGDGAFKGNAAITSVTIPSGVTCIGYEAFQGCESLASVTLPPTITDWCDDIINGYKSNAFQGCTALSQLTLPEGLASIGQNAFQGCVALDNVIIPSTIQRFRDTAFAGCTSLANLELKEGIRQIGYRAFQGCTALEEVKIPSTIENWGTINASGVPALLHDCAPFIDCTSLKKIIFTEGIKTLQGFQGVRGCPLIKELDIPASVEDIAYAFTDCDDLEKVTLHEGIKTIGTEAFKNCIALRKVDIPDTVTTIQYYAWDGCTSLERLIFPPLATTLEGSITRGCTSLRELYILAEAVKGYRALSLPEDGKLYCIEGSSTYNTYETNLPESEKGKLAAIPAAGVEVVSSEYAYDGSPHPAVTLKGTQEGDEIRYRLDDGDCQKDMPQITEPGTYAVEITVRRQAEGEPMRYSKLQSQTVMRKRQQTMHLSDIETEEGEAYVVTAEGYQGGGEPVYAYYLDAACTQPVSGKPEMAGEYYVRASMPETDHDLAVQSNVAKIIIRGKGASGTEPSAVPSAKPSTAPGTQPSTAPSTGPSTVPSARPSTASSAKPSTGPDTKPSKEPGNQDGDGVGAAKGATFTAGKLKYKITSAAKGKAAVQVRAPGSKKAKSLAIPARVKKDGVSYAVTSIGTGAFKNCKKLGKITIGKNVAVISQNAFSGCKALKKITVKSTGLKKVGKNALKGIHKKAVIKVPKKKLKTYRKLWKKKGQRNTVRIK